MPKQWFGARGASRIRCAANSGEHSSCAGSRATHTLAARPTGAYEGARESVRRFLNAGSAEEIVFVRGTTEGINLIANAWGGRYIEAGDEIIVTRIEHHSNIVPWQMLCARTGAKLRVAEVDDTGQIRLDQYERLFNQHTRLVSFTHVSTALGTILIDGAQSVCHLRVDVQQLDADFYVFSGHKVFGPTGIGAVYGKQALLQAMPPWQGGGNMIGDVTFDKTEYQPAPARFEAPLARRVQRQVRHRRARGDLARPAEPLAALAQNLVVPRR